mgnify:CR=1 FL=1|jgi:carbonic anhydrase
MSNAQKMEKIFEANRDWAQRVQAEDPGFFEKLSHLQAPEYLWIGCSDSRVPANEITGLLPGEVFVHRNIANVVVHTDLNCLSVIQFAIDVLKVRHIMVVGHFGCGGVRAALDNARLGLADNWLRHIQDVRDKHQNLLDSIANEQQRWACLCELNVLEQAINVARTTLVRDSWARDQALTVHGWIYGLKDGLLRDTGFIVSASDEIDTLAAQSLNALRSRYTPS